MMYARGQYNIRSLGEVVKIAPVTLPALRLDDIDVEAEAREAQARVAERRVIRRGLDAWAAVGAARSFESWKTIGAALSVGKRHALRVTGADRAWGRNYSREFGEWMKRHGFEAMPKSTRSVAIELPRISRRSPHGGTLCRNASASG